MLQVRQAVVAFSQVRHVTSQGSQIMVVRLTTVVRLGQVVMQF